ncbi:hypothetical protein KVV02_006300 [Mortierella alpina]|uniref:Histidine ammonia-lyase n=1 Tax=Mortierella alpina TaxID=64518 RepID=A0A9P8A6P9_MORAP|nr:hypothetical protein KVV02_006300 [Mortierella alpina]
MAVFKVDGASEQQVEMQYRKNLRVNQAMTLYPEEQLGMPLGDLDVLALDVHAVLFELKYNGEVFILDLATKHMLRLPYSSASWQLFLRGDTLGLLLAYVDLTRRIEEQELQHDEEARTADRCTPERGPRPLGGFTFLTEGSVGASGDLIPLTYLAAVLIGEREVMYEGKLCEAGEVLAKLGIEPLVLAPKEGLALVNGTAVMTGLAGLAWRRADYLKTRLACRVTALTTIALNGRSDHFDPRLFNTKPHIGQAEAAAWIRVDLSGRADDSAQRVQDRYSVRCAPHIIGVARDALGWIRRDMENELNSANDNPLIDPDNGCVLHGGNFYGGHIAFAMDALKTAVANVADLLDRQLALLVDSKFNHGLPLNLSGSVGE